MYYMKKIFVISLLFQVVGISANASSVISLIGQVPSVLYVALSPLPVATALPSLGQQSNIKIANYNVQSNHVEVSLNISCQSSSLDNTACFMKKSGAVSPSNREKIPYSISVDKDNFLGITNYNGGIYISYDANPTQITGGDFSDSITISVMVIE